MLMVGCVKDEPNARFLKLYAEGYSPDNPAKAAVSDQYTYWVDGDNVWINGSQCDVHVSGSNEAVIRQITENPSHEYRGVYPASALKSAAGNTFTVKVPKTHYYREDSDGKQIIDELPNIAAAGFTSVQTSPAQAARTEDGTWYYLYQPSGFYVGNAGLGSEDDLKRLCSEADKYGIKIIVDVVANHLAGDHTYIDDSLKPYEYWHNCYGGIDYNNRYEITHHNIGMPDINSENSYVQQKVQWYISQLKADGVDGIRWDAAKHISLPSEGCGFWSSVIDKSMFNYGEILDKPVCNNDGYANKLMSEYTDYMSVSDAVYSRSVMQAINSGSVPTGYGFWTLVNGIEDNEVVYFGETHDTYSNNTNNERRIPWS